MVANYIFTSRVFASRASELDTQMPLDVPRDTAHFQTSVHRAWTPEAFEVCVGSVHDTMTVPKMGDNVSVGTSNEHSTRRMLDVPTAAINGGWYLSAPRINGNAALHVYNGGVLRACRSAWTVG